MNKAGETRGTTSDSAEVRSTRAEILRSAFPGAFCPLQRLVQCTQVFSGTGDPLKDAPFRAEPARHPVRYRSIRDRSAGYSCSVAYVADFEFACRLFQPGPERASELPNRRCDLQLKTGCSVLPRNRS